MLTLDPVAVVLDPKDNVGVPVWIFTWFPSTSIFESVIIVGVPANKLTLDPVAWTTVKQ